MCSLLLRLGAIVTVRRLNVFLIYVNFLTYIKARRAYHPFKHCSIYLPMLTAVAGVVDLTDFGNGYREVKVTLWLEAFRQRGATVECL